MASNIHFWRKADVRTMDSSASGNPFWAPGQQIIEVIGGVARDHRR
jgi:hypothetical protein